MGMPSDEELMLAIGDGNLTAFKQVVPRYRPSTWKPAYRFTENAAEAEDLA